MFRMSNTAITYMVIAFASVFGLAAFVGLVLVPAWSAYGRFWERLAVTFLSFYVLAACIAIGIALGIGGIFLYDQLS